MMELNSLRLEGTSSQFYSLSFQRLNFLLLPTLPTAQLQFFSAHNQSALGKLNIHLNLEWLLAYPHFFAQTNYVLLTQYQQVALLPYLTTRYPSLRVMATHLMYELARIFLRGLQTKIKDMDVTRESMGAQDDPEVIGNYEEKFDLDLQKWRQFYPLKDIEAALSRVEKVNYHQIYDTERGVTFTALPSGKNNGACFWEISSTLTREKLLLINDLSQQQWRTCRPYSLEWLQQSEKHRPHDYVLFTRNALSRLDQQGEEVRIGDILKKLSTSLANHINTTFILADETVAMDLIPRVPMQPQGKCQALLLNSASFHEMSNFCNSYVDYLSDHFKGQIFSQSPQYPLIHYCRYRERGLVHVGELQEVVVRTKFPLLDVVLSKTPFVQFVKDYEYVLDDRPINYIGTVTKHEKVEVVVNNHFTRALLQEFLSVFKRAKVYGFRGRDGKGEAEGVNMLSLNTKYVLKDAKVESPVYLSVLNYASHQFQKYKLVSNQLNLQRQQRQFIMLPKNFLQILLNEFITRGISIILRDRKQLRTQRSHVTLSPEYVLKVVSSNCEELLLIERCLTSISKPYQLG